MSGKTYYIDNNGLQHLIKKKIHIDANGVPTQIKKKFFDGKNTFSSSHIVKYHVDVDDIRDIEVDDGGDAILWAPTPVRSGWIFTGWREDDEADPTVVDHKTVEVDGIELYAVFHKVITVTLQGGSAVVTNTGTRYYNNSNDESPVITLGYSAMSGWNLVGYRNDMTATSAVDYTAGQSYTFDESKTIYAVFSRTLTLSYNGNGATSGSVASQTGTQYYNNGYYLNPAITTRANGYARTDYNFNYWYNGATTVAAGNPITISSDFILYAHWTLSYNPDPNQWTYSPRRDVTAVPPTNRFVDGYVLWGGPRYISSVTPYVNKWGFSASGYEHNSGNVKYVTDNRTQCLLDIYVHNGSSWVLIATKSVSIEWNSSNNEAPWGAVPINGSYYGIRMVARDAYQRSVNPDPVATSWNTWFCESIGLNF